MHLQAERLPDLYGGIVAHAGQRSHRRGHRDARRRDVPLPREAADGGGPAGGDRREEPLGDIRRHQPAGCQGHLRGAALPLLVRQCREGRRSRPRPRARRGGQGDCDHARCRHPAGRLLKKRRRGRGDDDDLIPWPRLREIAFGLLGWGPAEFREATMRDLFDGLNGWMEANGAQPPEGVSADELDALMARYNDG
ncbi:MAG: phage tail assembly chaperone [Rhizobiales bacterium]|nr:phage tail assembly chaperone [Hyphomicrobiales bacterium]